MFLQQMPDKPTCCRTLLPQGIQSCLNRLRHLDQQPNHSHNHHPLSRYELR